VLNITEEEYVVKPRDSFEAISQDNYHSPAYAEALKRYVQDMQGNDAAKLQGGGRLWLPQAEVLQRRYGVKGTASPLPPASGKRADAETRMPAVPVATPNVQRASGVEYRVAAGGQTMREIARLTLGNGARWTEIYHFNQGYKPEYAVPAGTVLVLPGDARVSSEQPRR
jgi:nucleoid-associated protein YgaU